MFLTMGCFGSSLATMNHEPTSDGEPAGSTSSSLLDHVKANRPDAWQRLVRLYGPLVYRWCRVAGLQEQDAADVAQEVFRAVATRVATFRRDRPGDSFRGWLWGIARNKVGDHFRKLQRNPQAQGGTQAQMRLADVALPESADDLTDGDRAGRKALEQRAIELIRAGVEDRTWQVFRRLVVDGQTVADVADEFGMSTKAVYEAKYRVMRRVRAELGDLLD